MVPVDAQQLAVVLPEGQVALNLPKALRLPVLSMAHL